MNTDGDWQTATRKKSMNVKSTTATVDESVPTSNSFAVIDKKPNVDNKNLISSSEVTLQKQEVKKMWGDEEDKGGSFTGGSGRREG